MKDSLYEEEDLNKWEFIEKNLKYESKEDAIILNGCNGHYFHIGCVEKWIES